ncbi:MAG TPA: recombinase family protein [Dehalococcoidia bacterium]|nr:recombinase family protein [Dehalococcoidia bacterium]
MPERPKPKTLRCAIYTRKSSEEGLEQDFNSLHAQREACEAYVASQRHEGWKALPVPYDDGGFSGGSMERPALQALLTDIASGRIDVVVVYKVDRLTRSLTDFARIVEVFDRQGVSFVSVTQQFNTTSSMGRLTLNVLLSFAQFEREVTGERIRDKIAASKKKGMWMGGWVPIGYDRKDRSLVVNEAEAETVRTIFRFYLKRKNVRAVQADLDRLKLITKRYVTTTTGGAMGGLPFRRGHIYHILSNPLYVGEIGHKGTRHPGQHPAIIDQETWDAAQARLRTNGHEHRMRSNAKAPSLLAGLLFDGDGNRLTATHATKNGKRYRYYALMPSSGRSASRRERPAFSIAAAEIEGIVVSQIVGFLTDSRRLLEALDVHEAEPASPSHALAKQSSWRPRSKSGRFPSEAPSSLR